MARVILKVYTTLRNRLGFSEIEVEAKNLKDAIYFIVSKNQEIEKILMENKNKVKGYFVITINSEVIDNSRITNVKLKDGDIINIFPPVAGG